MLTNKGEALQPILAHVAILHNVRNLKIYLRMENTKDYDQRNFQSLTLIGNLQILMILLNHTGIDVNLSYSFNM
jgi:hypothetical protein